MTRDQLAASLRAAGYEDKAIRRAIRSAPAPVAEPASEASEVSTVEEPMTAAQVLALGSSVGIAASYITTHRDKFQREQITGRLRAAGHDNAVISAAWAESDRQYTATGPFGGRDLGDVLLSARSGAILIVLVVGGLYWIARFTVNGFPVGLTFLVLVVVVGAILAWRYLRRHIE